MSGQAVDNTLQLNKQGGGRIDIPLPENDGYLIEKIKINEEYSQASGGVVVGLGANFDTNGTNKAYIESNMPIYYTTNNFTIGASINIRKYSSYLPNDVANICNAVLKNLPDGNYDVLFCGDTQENMRIVYYAEYFISVSITNGVVTTEETRFYFGTPEIPLDYEDVYVTACSVRKTA